jgi:hypothetical protein
MTDNQAERWVTVSALVVAGVYAYRRLTETPGQPPVTVKELAGVGELPPLGAWATAWGFTFLVVAVIATAAPELGAAFAILIATGDLLTNAQSIFKDVGAQQKTGVYPAGTPTAQAIAATGHDPAQSQAGVTPGIFNTPTGPAPFKPPPGIRTVQ